MKTVANKFASPTFPGDAAANPKPEIRSPKEARSPKFEIGAGRSGFGSSFDFRNSFGFRISDFGILQAPSRSAFTLIELLVVIAIMGVLAALIFPVVHAVKIHQYIYNTQAEMAKLETAIERYKAVYGFYPPSNPGNSLTNQLYYELVGTMLTTNADGSPCYKTLDGSASINADATTMNNAFGVGGFVNCTKPGAGEDAAAARNFLPDLKPNQIGTNTVSGVAVTLLIGSVGGPDATYQPLGLPDMNPWRYNSSNPTNNPGSYELWVDLVFIPGTSTRTGVTNLICNWTKQVQINSPLP